MTSFCISSCVQGKCFFWVPVSSFLSLLPLLCSTELMDDRSLKIVFLLENIHFFDQLIYINGSKIKHTLKQTMNNACLLLLSIVLSPSSLPTNSHFYFLAYFSRVSLCDTSTDANAYTPCLFYRALHTAYAILHLAFFL